MRCDRASAAGRWRARCLLCLRKRTAWERKRRLEREDLLFISWFCWIVTLALTLISQYLASATVRETLKKLDKQEWLDPDQQGGLLATAGRWRRGLPASSSSTTQARGWGEKGIRPAPMPPPNAPLQPPPGPPQTDRPNPPRWGQRESGGKGEREAWRVSRQNYASATPGVSIACHKGNVKAAGPRLGSGDVRRCPGPSPEVLGVRDLRDRPPEQP